MKTKVLLLLSSLVLSTSLAFTATHTVSNHPLGGSQYNTLQAAYNAAANNDTILVEGTLTDNSLSSYSKTLVIIGQGLNTQKENFLPTRFEKASSGPGSYAKWYISSGGTGSKFYGITFVGDHYPEQSRTLMRIQASDILFENCKFDRAVHVNSSNVVFKNCIFTKPGALNISSVLNILFSNCIFNSELIGSPTSIVSVDHCIFLSTGTCFISCSGFDIRNCIFMNSTGVSGIASSDFQNNLCRNSFTFPPAGNNNLGGNQTAADPLFVTYTLDASYSTTHDYHLQSGSPAIGTASDATDIGVHGGYTNFSEYGEVLIAPVMRSMNISNNTVPANGTINVNVEASKPNDN